MKLYTRPRPLYPHQLQPGDQIATLRKGGDVLRSGAAYVDADLADLVVWSVVHYVTDVPGDESESLRVVHTLGEHDLCTKQPVIIREVIEIDPWTYVRPERGNPDA